jgi:outer membrane protein
MRRLLVSLSIITAAHAFPVLAQDPGPVKVGVFDAQRISEETAEGKRIQTQLSAFRDKKQAEIAAKEKEVTDLQGQLSSQALSLSPDKRAALEKDVQRRAIDLNQAREAAGREMQLEVNEAQNRFQAQLLSVVEKFGRDEGFGVILERSLVAYASQAVDVTTALVDRFNRAAPAAPAEAAPPKPAGESGSGKKQ